LEAFALAQKTQPNIRLVLLGDGPQSEALRRLAAELEIAERVTFVGKVPFEEIPNYLKAADIFAFASITETQGIVTLEAMAAGLPAVAVDASGTRDILEDGKQGFLTPNDPEALANRIIEVIASPSLMSKFKSAALRTSGAFDNKRLARKMLKVYEQAIEDKKNEQYVTVEDPSAIPITEKVAA
jgi:glycosyltransferase involved in cell wall biosynthesis